MHDQAFASAARPGQQVILKLLMRPYSVGHEILLLQQGNPLVILSEQGIGQLSEDEKRMALFDAVFICYQTWEKNLKPHRLRRYWGWKNRKADWQLEIAKFLDYRDDGSTFPPTPTEEADMIANGNEGAKGREIGGPFLARLYNHVAAFPYNEIKLYGTSAFDFPLGLATFLYFSHLESNGELKIENSKEAQIREEMKGHRETINKEDTCQGFAR